MRIETYISLRALREGNVPLCDIPVYVRQLGREIGKDIKRMSANGLNSDEVLYFLYTD